MFAQVGFESSAFRLADIAAGTSRVVICRAGTYGPLSVTWTTGFAAGVEIPELTVVGNMTPVLGELALFQGWNAGDVSSALRFLGSPLCWTPSQSHVFYT